MLVQWLVQSPNSGKVLGSPGGFPVSGSLSKDMHLLDT